MEPEKLEKQDADKIILLSQGLNDLVECGEDVLADGKIGLDDIQHLGELAKASQKVIKAVSAYREMFAEAKDIDPAEAVAIVQALLGK